MKPINHTCFHFEVDALKSIISFSGSSLAFKSEWKKCHLFTDQICELSKQFLPKKNQDLIYSLSTVINELIENAVKFSIIEHPNIAFNITFQSNKIIINSSNYCTHQNYEFLLEAKNKVTLYNPDDLFFTHLQSIESETNVSKIGIITLFQFPNTKIFLTKTSYTDYLHLKVTVSFNINEI